MKKQLLLLLTACLSLTSYSQIILEKGYFIDNTNQKVDCLIKNNDWKNCPTQFTYQLSEGTALITLKAEDVKEFGIYTVSKFIRYDGNIDISSDNLDRISDKKNPVFEEQTLFLKVLLEGKANLYQYDKEGMGRFYYNKDGAKIKPLVFKLYRDEKSTVRKNDEFKKQLWNDLKCPDVDVAVFESLKYEKNDLVNFFKTFNKCNNSEIVTFEKKPIKNQFHLSLRPGLNSSSLEVDMINSNTNNVELVNKFGNKMRMRFGVEAEFILPFNKNKWSLIFEPAYQGYSNEIEKTFRVGTIAEYKEIYKVDYTSIEFALGLRYYMFLNNNSKLFINGSFVFDKSLGDSKIDLQNYADLTINKSYNFALGLGYKYNKYNLELRYQNRDVLNDYSYYRSDYKSVSIIFGYTLF